LKDKGFADSRRRGRNGGTGRRAGLKIRWSQGRGGSSPPSGMKETRSYEESWVFWVIFALMSSRSKIERLPAVEHHDDTENSWAGRTLAIGVEVILRIAIPVDVVSISSCLSPICCTTPASWRTVARHNMQDFGDFGTLPCVGIYADVVKRSRG
jgi:hypothetical protein